MEELAKQTEPCVGCLPSLSPGRTPTPCSQLSPEWEAPGVLSSGPGCHALSLKPHFPTSDICALQFLALSFFSVVKAGAPVLQLLPFCGSRVSVTMIQSRCDSKLQLFQAIGTQIVIVCTALLRREAPGLCSPPLCHPYSPSFKHTPSLPPTCPIPHFPNLTSLMGFCGPGWHAWDSSSLPSSLLYSLTLPLIGFPIIPL